VKPVPVMVTVVPPAVEPNLGLTAVTLGVLASEYWTLSEIAVVA
jgi:hypothetical protein